MKVLMITPDCYMIDRRIIQEAKTLASLGYEITLLAGFECEQEEEYKIDNVSIFRYKYDWHDQRLKKIELLLSKYLARKIGEVLRKILLRIYFGVASRLFKTNPFDAFVLSKVEKFKSDIIHVHDLPFLEIGAIAAKKWDAFLVYDSHEIYYEQNCLSLNTKKRLMASEAKYIHNVNLMITVNNEIAKYFASKYTISMPLVLMNCTEKRKFDLNGSFRQELLSSLAKSPNTKIVLYQGWISDERNIETLVRSSSYFDMDTILIIIGYGAYEEKLKEIVSRNKLNDKVFFLGKIPSNDILKYTVIADLGVIPYLPIDLNHRLCSPNKFFEYIVAGVPVLTHDLPFFRYMSQLYGGILLGDLSSVQSMSNCLNLLLSDDQFRYDLRQESINAGQYLNWDVESQKLKDAYALLISQLN